MKRFLICALFALIALCWAQAALAAGPHDYDCMECHSTHYAKGDYIIGVEPNTRAVNPATSRVGMHPAEIDALCLGCHNDAEGIMPVNLATTHPTGIRPQRTPVPQELLWDGVFSCTSCHDPHPLQHQCQVPDRGHRPGHGRVLRAVPPAPDRSGSDAHRQGRDHP